MKRKYIGIICFSVFLFLVAAFCGMKELVWDNRHSISVEIQSDGKTEEVKLWMDPGERYYLFLPSYADLSQTRIRCNVFGSILLDYKKVTEDMDITGLPMNEPMELILDSHFRYQWNELTILQSANIPTMYIDVKSGSMDYIHAQKGNQETGSMRLYTADGKLDAKAVVESLQGRGNSTWQWHGKKPYGFCLSTETDLLGMGKASRWVLLANAYDKSSLKNKIAYDLARNAGMPYAPDCQWVDLYLNGEYAGLYLLSERNEIHENRVDIPAESSFLVAWEHEPRMIAQGDPYVKTERGTAIRVHQSAFPLEEVQRMWQSVENAIFAEDGIDVATGKHWQDLIDIDSWARLFLIDEISADYDGGKLSKFFYYQETEGVGKIYAGPVWDKDNTFAPGHWAITPPNCLVASRSKNVDGKEQRMFHGLSQQEAFANRVTELYQKVFLPELQKLCDTSIENYAQQIAQAAKLSEIRWDLGYTEEQSLIIQTFLRERMEFLDAYWIRKEDFCHVKVIDTYEYSEGEFAVCPGDAIPVPPEYDPILGVWGWYGAETGESFDVTQPIYEDITLILRKVG